MNISVLLEGGNLNFGTPQVLWIWEVPPLGRAVTYYLVAGQTFNITNSPNGRYDNAGLVNLGSRSSMYHFLYRRTSPPTARRT